MDGHIPQPDRQQVTRTLLTNQYCTPSNRRGTTGTVPRRIGALCKKNQKNCSKPRVNSVRSYQMGLVDFRWLFTGILAVVVVVVEIRLIGVVVVVELDERWHTKIGVQTFHWSGEADVHRLDRSHCRASLRRRPSRRRWVCRRPIIGQCCRAIGCRVVGGSGRSSDIHYTRVAHVHRILVIGIEHWSRHWTSLVEVVQRRCILVGQLLLLVTGQRTVGANVQVRVVIVLLVVMRRRSQCCQSATGIGLHYAHFGQKNQVRRGRRRRDRWRLLLSTDGAHRQRGCVGTTWIGGGHFHGLSKVVGRRTQGERSPMARWMIGVVVSVMDIVRWRRVTGQL